MRTSTARLTALMAAMLLLLAACGGAEDTADVSDLGTEVSEATTEPLASEPATEMTEPGTDLAEGTDATEPADMAEPADLTTALQDAGLGSLAAAVESAGLTEQLEQLPEFTLFAPSDEAFTDVSTDLSTLDPAEVQDILTYHVVDQRLLSTDLQEGENTVTTLQGSDLMVTVEGGDVSVGEAATVTQPDIQVGDSGVIHVIDQILMPSP